MERLPKSASGKADKILTYSFWLYNMGGALLKSRKRKHTGAIEDLE